ncbi:FISUMP domain-containing protein [Flavobacterium sp.]|jgi:uncharacterized protein (TIGR02145 family)|uniref:FISUMP domain-containing protein n=1 Tax=Flavobacterium sp. TaxID=239 RepID=UPI0037BEE478
MKKLYTLLALVITLITFAQAPQGFNYQATVRNSSGALIVNQNVFFKFNLMLNSASSVPVFSETHYTPTDDLGQVNIVIGQGTATVGTFSTINWGTGNYYLGIELNTGSGYIAMGTTQLLSVPYALYANSAGNSQAATPNLTAVLAVNNGANNLQIKNLANPTDAQDAVTKQYLDSKIPNGTAIGDNLSWNGTNWVVTPANTSAQLPQLTTTTATGITPFAATSGGTITGDGGFSIISKGVAWSTSPNPTINDNFTNNGSGATSFQSVLTNLLPGTSYYYRAYATNTVGTGYGMSFSLITHGLATLSTNDIIQINSNSATSGGNITSNGGVNVTARGVCWSTSPNATVDLVTKTVNGSGSGLFSSSITQLAPATTYYLRAYATNAAGTAYGIERIFTTSVGLPLLTTEVSSITSTTASGLGTITNNGGGTITVSGIVWGTTTNPTLTTNIGSTSDGTLIGFFISNLTGLIPGTTYYVRSYATNSAGTGYGNQITFSTLPVLATVTTTEIMQINSYSAVSGGNITSNGGANVTARGVCWSTSLNPTIALNTKTVNGSGNGLFTSNLTGLTAGTTYYLRAYATNAAGTAYGNEILFTTLAAVTCSVGEVTINNQIWSGCNLDVTAYRDGTPIPQVTDPSQWANLTTGAWCYYNNDPANGDIYGKLYNWYAVAGIHDNDPSTPNKILAPTGWHVPSDAEWNTLTTFLGGLSVAGGMMKSTSTLWQSPNTGATNSSGFTGIPGGHRGNNFESIGDIGVWWSSSEQSTQSASHRNLHYLDIHVTTWSTTKFYGYSVRCLRD